MAFTEICCRSGGSNLNSGSRNGSSTEPGVAADFTYASGSWVASTGVFSVASGNPLTDGVAVGDFASVYADGATLAVFIGRVTARDATTITVSLTVKSGTAPTDGTNTRTLKVGGAWQGPNAAVAFPFGFVSAAMVNLAGDVVRVNFKNNATFAITAAMVHAIAGPVFWQGYTTSYGDFGKARIDGGTTGASYLLLNCSASSSFIVDMIFSNNGATGSADGVQFASTTFSSCVRVIVHDIRGRGFISSAQDSYLVECESYGNNKDNNTRAGFHVAGPGTTVIRCYSHDNGGVTGVGFEVAASTVTLINCISDSNASHGATTGANTQAKFIGCDFYNNGGSGISGTTNARIYAENCNFVKNGVYGFNGPAAGVKVGRLVNCGFGSGTQVNSSGQTNNLGAIEVIGSITYAADVTPWIDPANGDFRINLAAAKNAGRGAFTQIAGVLTVGYPDVGAAQATVTASGGLQRPVPMSGGLV